MIALADILGPDGGAAGAPAAEAAFAEAGAPECSRLDGVAGSLFCFVLDIIYYVCCLLVCSSYLSDSFFVALSLIIYY